MDDTCPGLLSFAVIKHDYKPCRGRKGVSLFVPITCQSDGGNSSVRVPSSQMTGICQDTKPTSMADSPWKMKYPQLCEKESVTVILVHSTNSTTSLWLCSSKLLFMDIHLDFIILCHEIVF